MSKTVTIELTDDTYSMFCNYAKSDNRSLSNFIETSALRYISEHEYVDDFEMTEINTNNELQQGLKKAYKDAKQRKGKLVK
ncbi:hypothetical protein QUF74_18220 [Candidatus Halobeggiatoa sp. HSG11]|nr:hypothetical protein [Candidatus Halobeggiatoa sp. HSG11]